jgi:hypothetical protein
MAPLMADPVSATTGNLCAICPNNATNTCQDCDNIKYCSAACQRLDADQHNTLCSTFKDFQHRPSENHYRAIYFPTNEPKPRFIWLRMRGRRGHEKVDENHLAQYVPGSRYSGGSPITEHYGITPLRQYKHSMLIYHDREYFFDGQPPNQCFGTMIDELAADGRRGGHVAHAFKYTYRDSDELWDEDDRLCSLKFPHIALDLDTTSLGPLLAWIKAGTRSSRFVVRQHV